jgi:hypothetical protein
MGEKEKGGRMTTGGIIFMTLTWALIIGFTVFCFAKVFKTQAKPPADKDM